METMKAIHLKSGGEQSLSRPLNGKYFTDTELRTLVGGDFRLAYLADGRVMVVNERHEIDGLPLNIRATEIVRSNELSGDIHGDALICESKYIK